MPVWNCQYIDMLFLLFLDLRFCHRMRKALFISALLLLAACQREKKTEWFNAAKAKEYFSAVEEVCTRDNGQLWGENLYGPVMYVDGLSRTLYASQPDREGLLKLKDGVYSGILPGERIIANNVIEFG